MRELLITSGGCWCMIWNLCFNYAFGIVEIDVSTTLNAIPLPLAVLQSLLNTEGLWKVVCCKCNSIVFPGMAELPMGFQPSGLVQSYRKVLCELGPSLFSLRSEAKSSSLVIAMPALLNLPEKLCLFLQQCLLTKPSIICLTYKLVCIFTTLPTFHLTELQEHGCWLWQAFIHVKITNYLPVIQFLVQFTVFQVRPGRQY